MSNSYTPMIMLACGIAHILKDGGLVSTPPSSTSTFSTFTSLCQGVRPNNWNGKQQIEEKEEEKMGNVWVSGENDLKKYQVGVSSLTC